MDLTPFNNLVGRVENASILLNIVDITFFLEQKFLINESSKYTLGRESLKYCIEKYYDFIKNFVKQTYIGTDFHMEITRSDHQNLEIDNQIDKYVSNILLQGENLIGNLLKTNVEFEEISQKSNYPSYSNEEPKAIQQEKREKNKYGILNPFDSITFSETISHLANSLMMSTLFQMGNRILIQNHYEVNQE